LNSLDPAPHRLCLPGGRRVGFLWANPRGEGLPRGRGRRDGGCMNVRRKALSGLLTPP